MNKQCMKADMHHWLTILDDLRNSTSDLKRNTLSKFLWNQACLKIEILKHFFSCFFCTHKTNTGVLIFCCHVAEYHKVSSLKQYQLFAHSPICGMAEFSLRISQGWNQGVGGGVPIVAQQKQTWLVSIRMHVWSLASLSGSRIWHCCGYGWQLQLRFDP